MVLEEYFCPSSIQEVLEILEYYQGQARVIAGGTDLIPELKKQTRRVRCLVDISGIEELNKIKIDSNDISIGAGATLNGIASSKQIIDKFPALARAAAEVGSPQIRNIATIGGNICSARPAADTIGPLIGYRTRVKIVNKEREKWLALEELFTGPGETILKSGEILTGISVKPPAPDTYSTYTKFGLRRALAIAVVSVTSIITLEPGSGICKEARIVLGAVAPTLIRCSDSEKVLVNNKITANLARQAGILAAQSCRPISDIRGSTEYRKEIVKVLVRRAIEQTIQMANKRDFVLNP